MFLFTFFNLCNIQYFRNESDLNTDQLRHEMAANNLKNKILSANNHLQILQTQMLSESYGYNHQKSLWQIRRKGSLSI